MHQALTGIIAPEDADILSRLREIVGADKVHDELAERTFFSTDIASSGSVASAVVTIDSTDELSKVVAACSAMDYAVVPRGGGFSYTGGYTPVSEKTVIIDLRGIDQIFEINAEDMYVRVGAGCTWHTLYQALRAQGLRTPYYGPMSGYSSTVGGALSQGSFFLGSTEFGTTADSVLSLEVVLADGDIIHTGSDSAAGAPPFFRNYGPDLTGLFLGDTGALGFKTIATLKLIRFPPHQAYGSFAFKNAADAMAALSEIGRAGLAAEAYCWDPFFVESMSHASTGIEQDAQFLWNVIRNGAGILGGLRIVLAGKSVFRPNVHIIQVIADDHSKAGAAARMKSIRAIARQQNADELAPSVPMALRGSPFTEFNIPERRTSMRNIPTHGLFAHSRAPAALAAMQKLFDDQAAEIERHGMKIGTILFAVGRQAMAIEPLFFWDDAEHFLHNRVEELSDVAGLSGYGERPAATAFAFQLREQVKEIFTAHGAAHMQIGKSYPYLSTREPRIAKLLKDIKASLDLKNTVNPGSLGLGSDASCLSQIGNGVG